MPATTHEAELKRSRRSRFPAPKEQGSRDEISALWQEIFKRPMPLYTRSTVLADCLAFQQQLDQGQELSMDAQRALMDHLPLQPRNLRAKKSGPRRFKPGTRLLRAWQGRTYAVTIADPGFLFEGRTYRSLSMIAREITGTAWSGPAFFGLLKRYSKKANHE